MFGQNEKKRRKRVARNDYPSKELALAALVWCNALCMVDEHMDSGHKDGGEGAVEPEPASDAEQLRQGWNHGVRDGPPPRPVDKDLIRKYLRHELEPALYHEVEGLIADYRVWRKAEIEVLLTERETHTREEEPDDSA